MIISPSRECLDKLLRHQIHNLFLLEDSEEQCLEQAVPDALSKVEKCFSLSANKYYVKDGEVFFSVYHSGQYCIFLYFLSRVLFLNTPECRKLADKIYYLNKALNGLDLYYEVQLPDVFFLDHPVGSVMGRATYGAGFSFSQLCTVGNNKGIYPVIGESVKMMSGSKILGNSHIGDNVTISANAYIKDENVPDNCIVFGSSPNLIIKLKHQKR